MHVSRFNVLMHGEAGDVADELSTGEADVSELCAALQNAMIKIERLEKQIENLRKDINE
jgi:peptidoglycan hydrolase CwlO-like protein